VVTPQVAAVPDSLAGGMSQHAVMSVVAPNAIPQQATVIGQGVRDTHGARVKGKDNEGHGPLKKKEEDKTGCFRCKQPGHYIDDCPTPFVISVSQSIMQPQLVTFFKLQSLHQLYIDMQIRHSCFLNFPVVLLKPKLRIQS
jgi:hypothetical protein